MSFSQIFMGNESTDYNACRHSFSEEEMSQLCLNGKYVLILICSGKAFHKFNGRIQIVSRGTFCLLSPKDDHKFEFFNSFNCESIWWEISEKDVENSCKIIGLNIFDNIADMTASVDLKESYFDDIMAKMVYSEQLLSEVGLNKYIMSLLPYFLYIIFESEASHKKTDELPPSMAEIIEKMSRKDNFVEGLDRLISLSNSSQEHITREFRRHLDLTPTEFINMKRVNYAAKVLLSGEREIIDVCFLSGFNNLSHFYHNFKKYYESSPRQFVKAYGRIDTSKSKEELKE